MKPSSFGYHLPASVPEAVGLLAEHGGDARVLAGGQSLVPMLNMRLLRPAALVDVNDVDGLDEIRPHGDGATTVGALVRYSTIERSALLAGRLPLLTRTVRHIGDRQVRNRGTLGGALAQGDPTGEMPLACLTLAAVVVVTGPAGTRRIPVEEFYVGSYATALEPCELITAVEFPPQPVHVAFAEICRKHNDFAVVSVAVTGHRDPDGTWRDIRLGLGGVADTPVLARDAAAALEGTGLSAGEIEEAAAAALAAADPPSDVRASAEYRGHLLRVYVGRVLAELRESAA